MTRTLFTFLFAIFLSLSLQAQSDLFADNMYASAEVPTYDNTEPTTGKTKVKTATVANPTSATALNTMRKPSKPMVFFSADQVKVVLWSPEEASATIMVHTAEGKKVKEVNEYLLDRTKNEIIMATTDLEPGTYWLSFFKDGQLLSSRSYTK